MSNSKMNRIQLLMCLFGISATLLANTVEARSARRLEGEGIIGGDDAKDGQFPYQISLEVLNKNVCGGSILTERFVITAAHCVVEDDGSFMGYPIKVIGGINNLKFKYNKHRVSVGVVKVYVPKEYDPTDRLRRETGDIAILELNKNLDIEGNPKLGKVELPEGDETYAGKKAVISGFGWNKIDMKLNPFTNTLEETGGYSYKKMRYAKANVMTNEECQKYYDDPIDEKHMCAGLVQRNAYKPEGVCSGDSGGPLVYEDVQIGVVSYSPLGCRENKLPSIYTRVTKYLDFINKVVSGKIDEDIREETLKVEV